MGDTLVVLANACATGSLAGCVTLGWVICVLAAAVVAVVHRVRR
jgi:hypothetical protein